MYQIPELHTRSRIQCEAQCWQEVASFPGLPRLLVASLDLKASFPGLPRLLVVSLDLKARFLNPKTRLKASPAFKTKDAIKSLGRPGNKARQEACYL